MDMASYLRPLAIDQPKLETLSIDLSRTYRHLALHSTEQFLATPINVLPNGTERGTFLAIDVGGSNLRVGFVELLGAKSDRGRAIRRLHERSWPIEDHFKMDQADELFSWIGSCIALQVAEYCDATTGAFPDGVIPFGITFSFPMMYGIPDSTKIVCMDLPKQTHISEARLMAMGKGFAIDSEVELGEMILQGYSKHAGNVHTNHGSKQNLPKLPEIRIVAISNDTVATLASLAYSAHALPSSRVAMGLIVGTGTNSSVTMKLKYLHEAKRASIVLPAKADMSEAEIVVNTEWTIKGAAGPLRRVGLINQWDMELDRCCEAPGFQPFEYMTAGRYLGELCRLILNDYLAQQQHVDTSILPEALRNRNSLSTFFLSNVVAKSKTAADLLPQLKRELPPPSPEQWQWTEEIADFFIAATRELRLRSASMVAAAVVGLLASAGELQWKDEHQTIHTDVKPRSEELIVAFAGGVITSFPEFLDLCEQKIDSLVQRLTRTDIVKRVVLRDANDGGLVGAGVLAGTVWNLP